MKAQKTVEKETTEKELHLIVPEDSEDTLQLISLYGDVDEEKCLEVIQAMRILAAMRKNPPTKIQNLNF